jgi:hypothetical protein
MDNVDLAEKEINNYTNAALKKTRALREHKIYPNGECHYCGSEVGEIQLFCNNYCADYYEVERKLSR